MEVGLSFGDIVLDGDPADPTLKGHSPPPNFRPMSVVGQTAAELLFLNPALDANCCGVL